MTLDCATAAEELFDSMGDKHKVIRLIHEERISILFSP